MQNAETGDTSDCTAVCSGASRLLQSGEDTPAKCNAGGKFSCVGIITAQGRTPCYNDNDSKLPSWFADWRWLLMNISSCLNTGLWLRGWCRVDGRSTWAMQAMTMTRSLRHVKFMMRAFVTVITCNEALLRFMVSMWGSEPLYTAERKTDPRQSCQGWI